MTQAFTRVGSQDAEVGGNMCQCRDCWRTGYLLVTSPADDEPVALDRPQQACSLGGAVDEQAVRLRNPARIQRHACGANGAGGTAACWHNAFEDTGHTKTRSVYHALVLASLSVRCNVLFFRERTCKPGSKVVAVARRLQLAHPPVNALS